MKVSRAIGETLQEQEALANESARPIPDPESRLSRPRMVRVGGQARRSCICLTDVVPALLGLGDGELLAAARERAPVVESRVGLLVPLRGVQVRVAADGSQRDLKVRPVAVEHVDEVVNILAGRSQAEHRHAALELSRHHRGRDRDHIGRRGVRADSDDEHAGFLARRASPGGQSARAGIRPVHRDQITARVGSLPGEVLVSWHRGGHGDVQVGVAGPRGNREVDPDARVAGRVGVVRVAAPQGDPTHQRLAVHQRDRAHVAGTGGRRRNHRVARVGRAEHGEPPLAQSEPRVLPRDLEGIPPRHLALPLEIGGRRAQVLAVVSRGDDVHVRISAERGDGEGHVGLGVVREELVLLHGARGHGGLNRHACAQRLPRQATRRRDGVVAGAHAVHLRDGEKERRQKQKREEN